MEEEEEEIESSPPRERSGSEVSTEGEVSRLNYEVWTKRLLSDTFLDKYKFYDTFLDKYMFYDKFLDKIQSSDKFLMIIKKYIFYLRCFSVLLQMRCLFIRKLSKM
jgi:hypothetical protein